MLCFNVIHLELVGLNLCLLWKKWKVDDCNGDSFEGARRRQSRGFVFTFLYCMGFLVEKEYDGA